MENENIRLRIAPSPTGYAHLGSIYVAHFNRTLADKFNGTLLWRSEDTDRLRIVDDADSVMSKSLEWFDIKIDEGVGVGGEYGPYKQSDRVNRATDVNGQLFEGNIYQYYAKKMIENDDAYYAFDTKEELAEMRKEQTKAKQQPKYDKRALKLSQSEIDKRLKSGAPYVIRLNVRPGIKIECYDELRGEIFFQSDTIDDQILIKEDGFPTYHLAVVVDDHLMKITHVVRASEWLPSFPKQKLIHEYLNFKMPKYIHIPSILKEVGEGKLSKRDQESNTYKYMYDGYLPEAVKNYLSNLGFSHPDQKDIYSYEEFVHVFDLDRVLTQLPRFDSKKLNWINGQYIRALSSKDLETKFERWLNQDFEVLSEKLENLKESQIINQDIELFKEFYNSLSINDKQLYCEMIQTRIKYFKDAIILSEFMYKQKDHQNIKELTKHKSMSEVNKVIEWFISKIEMVQKWDLSELKKIEKDTIDKASELGWKNVEIFTPIRILSTKSKVSPPLFESIYLIGKEATLKNLNYVNSIN